MSLTNARDLINNSRRNLNLNVLKYPDDIDSVPHKIIFRFIKRNTSVSDRQFRITSQNTKDYLVLPVPTNIQDGVNLTYTAENLNLSGEVISNIIRGISLPSGGDVISNATTLADQLYSGFRTNVGSAFLSGAMAQSLAGSAAAEIIRNLSGRNIQLNPQNIDRAIAQGLGQVVNPFTTAIFQAVKLRTFSFEWNFSPSKKEESLKIEEIIKTLRLKALPKVKASNGNAFMEFPDEVEFSFLGMQNDTFSFPTSPCVIQGFNVDRTPTGNPVFFAGTGAPAFFNISLSLLEIRPLVAQDVEINGRTTTTVTSNPNLTIPSR